MGEDNYPELMVGSPAVYVNLVNVIISSALLSKAGTTVTDMGSSGQAANQQEGKEQEKAQSPKPNSFCQSHR